MAMAIEPPGMRSSHAEDSGFEPRADFVAFDLNDVEQSLTERLRLIAGCHRDAVAIVDGDSNRTYEQLVQRAGCVATVLRRELSDRPGPIAVLLPTSINAIELAIGILQAGRPYLFLPIDTEYSIVSEILEQTQPIALLTDATHAATLRNDLDIGEIRCLQVAEVLEGSARAEPSFEDSAPADLACLFATSGTTGAAKIVGLSHRAIMFDVGRQINDLFLGPDDRIDLLGHPSFSASLSSIFTAILSGAQLHIFTAKDRVSQLGQWLSDSRITISTMTVSQMRALCGSLTPDGGPAHLRLASVGAEPLFARDVRLFYSVFPMPCVLQNAMASTEVRTYAQYFVPRSTVEDGWVPIGWPVQGKEVIILGVDGQPIALGESGEIAVRSRYLADGYYRNAALTEAKFSPQSDGSVLYLTGDRGSFRTDGCLLFHGRTDSMVKIRGFRVETGMVEATLRRCSRVQEAAVVSPEIAGQERYLAAYVVLDSHGRKSTSEIEQECSAMLPAAAVPTRIVLLEQLPKNRNGKTDYRALEEAELREVPRTIRHAPDETLSVLVALWRDVLERSDLGINDCFFANGGDSISALRLQLGVYQQLGYDLPLEVLIRHSTAKQLAGCLSNQHHSFGSTDTLVAIHDGGRLSPIFCAPGIGGDPLELRDLASRFHDRSFYGLRTALVKVDSEPWSIHSMAAKCLQDILTVLDPDDPLLICGYCYGAFIAFEIARQALLMGLPVGFLGVIDMPRIRSSSTLLRKLRYISGNLPAWIRYSQNSDWAIRFNRIADDAKRFAEQRLSAIAPSSRSNPDERSNVANRSAPEFLTRRRDERIIALRNYQFHRLPLRLTVFRARAQALYQYRDRYLGWHEFAESIDVCIVPGNHTTCLKEPYVQELARNIQNRLAGDHPTQTVPLANRSPK